MRWYSGAVLGGAMVMGAAAVPDKPLAAVQGARPRAPVDHVTDMYFGKPLADAYRWMEAPSPAFDAWTRTQDADTRAALARIPGRDALRRHMDDIAGKMTIVTAVTPVGHRVFFRRQDAGSDLAKLVVRDTDTGRDQVLMDPNRVMIGGHHVSIDQFQPSQDGHYVAVGVSPGGSEEDVLAILDADTGRRLPDTIDRARFASVSWLPDGRSFFYNRLRLQKLGEAPADRYAYQKVFIHRLGTDPGQDAAIFGAGVSGLTTIAASDVVAVAAIIGSRTVLGIQNDGVSPEIALYVAQIPDRPGPYAWRRIVNVSDGIVDVAAGRDMLYFRSHRDAPRYKVIAVSLDNADLATAKTIVPQADGVLTNIAVSADALYVAGRNGAASYVLRVGADGKAGAVEIAGSGVDRASR